jgi:GIY-YIG catalytic domain
MLPSHGRVRGSESRRPLVAIIYALLDPDTRAIKYVGSTNNLQHRLRLHWVQRFYRTTQVATWLRTLNREPEVWEIQKVSDDQRWLAEEYWTDLLNQVLAYPLLNVVSGRHSVGGRGRVWTEQQRKRLSERRKSAGNFTAVRGEDNSNAKLTDDNVREIRSSSENAKILGEKFNVSPRTIHAVRRKNGSWKHIT